MSGSAAQRRYGTDHGGPRSLSRGSKGAGHEAGRKFHLLSTRRRSIFFKNFTVPIGIQGLDDAWQL